MTLFFIGIIEMIIMATWTKVVSNTQIVASGIITMMNIFVWYYVLRIVIDNINNWHLVLFYAFGCAIGTVLSTAYFQYRSKNIERSVSEI
ncbi:MAG: DUF5698 domain-containing protein [Candidatus Magasanikbacteria bacterium]